MPRPDFPKSLPQFIDWFPDEESCAEYLFESRWPDGFVCPNCGHDEFYEIEKFYRLQCVKCRYHASITAGTVFHSTKMTLKTWFYAVFIMTTLKPGISAYQLGKEMGISHESAYTMLHKLRTGMVDPDRSPLRGQVEVDESYIGGPEAEVRGRGARGKAITVGAVEVRGPYAGRLRLRMIPDVTARSLEKFVRENVVEGTTVITDGLKSYNGLRDMGYRHVVRVVGDPQEAHKKLPHIHRAFGNLKVWLIGTYHGVEPKHLQAYLNEFVFRFNRRLTPMAAFQTALGIGTQVEGPTYEELYSAGEKGGWKHLGGVPNEW